MRGPHDAHGPKAVARFLRPHSVAIVGISSRAGSAGQVILQSLKLNNFEGDIHLVSRTSVTIDGRPVLKSPDELPEGVDLAVFTLPAAGVRAAIEACARRSVASALIFAAGFAEVGDQTTQDAVTATARAGGLSVVGPNCPGLPHTLYVLCPHQSYRPARRQPGRVDATGPGRQSAQGPAAPTRRADRRFRHDTNPGRGRRRRRGSQHG